MSVQIRTFVMIAVFGLWSSACSAQAIVDAFLYNPKADHWVMTYPYPKDSESVEMVPTLSFEGHGMIDGAYTLAYAIDSGGKILKEGEVRVACSEGVFRAEVKFGNPLPGADAVKWRLSGMSQTAVSGSSALKWSRFHGKVKYVDTAIHQSTYLKMVPMFFDAPGQFMIPVGEDGSFDALVPARVYTVIQVNSSGYLYNSLERWAWDYDLRKDREDEFLLGRTEIYGMRAFNILTTKLGKRTIVLMFRPTSLSRALRFDTNGNGLIDADERRAMLEALGRTPSPIAPELTAKDIKAWLNGQSIAVVQLNAIPEYDGNGIWQLLYVVQCSVPDGIHLTDFDELKVEVQSAEQLHDKKLVDFGQGSVGFQLTR